MDLFEIIIAIIIAIAGGVISFYVCKKLEHVGVIWPLRRLLNFGNDKIIITFALRDQMPDAILPRISTEDFLSINNVISTLIKGKMDSKIKIRDTTRLNSQDEQRNIITICSSKTNSFTRKVLDELKDKGINTPRFEIDPGTKRWQIDYRGETFHSESFNQIQNFAKEHLNTAEQEIDDFALIMKVTNPWNPANKILIVAGIRGFGTWGAAECLKKRWTELYEKKSNRHGCKKNGDFAALVAIKYKNYDLMQPDIRQFIDLDGK